MTPRSLTSTFLRYDLPVIFRMLLPTLFIVAVGLHFHEFILKAIMANKAINAGIILTAGFGVVIIFLRLLDVQRDMRALDRFNKEALATGDMKKLIHMPWLKGRAIWHYLEHIAHTEGMLASQLDQDAIQNELEALSEEYSSKMELPQFLVGFMIAMGLLGTFIGLLETLTGISGMLDGMGHGGDIQAEFSKLVVELRKPLAGMGIAFSASMFGLVTSLQLSIMMIMLRRYTSRVMEKARSVMHTLLTRIKAKTPDLAGAGTRAAAPAFPADSSLLFEKLGEASFRTQEAVSEMAATVSSLERRLDSTLRAIEGAADASRKTNELLALSPSETGSNEGLVEQAKAIAASQEGSQRLVQKIVNSLIQIDQSLMSASTKEVVITQRESLGTLNELFGNSQTQTRLIGDLLEDQRESSRDLAQTFKALQERMAKQETLQTTTAHHMGEMKETLQRALSSFALIESVADNIAKQTAFLKVAMTEERNARTASSDRFEQGMRNFMQELRETLEKKQEKSSENNEMT